MKKSGFTLIELLVVIGIISTLLLIGVGALTSYYRIQTFNVGVADVVTTLQTAKSYAQSQVVKKCVSPNKFRGYNVTVVNTSTYALNEVCDSGSPQLVEQKMMHKDLTISSSDSPITFGALTGIVEPSATDISVTINGYGRSQIIKVNTGGSIYVCPISGC